jgi:capsular polysaccharide biosynthesis protein
MEAQELLREVIKFVKKYIWFVLLFGIIGALVGRYVIPSSPPTTYQASSSILIEKELKETNVIINQTEETTRFLNTVQTLIKTPVILLKVQKELGVKTETKDLANQITVVNENGSNIIKITVENTDKSSVADLANTIISVFEKEAEKYLDVGKIFVVEEAVPGQETIVSHDRSVANTIMGIILGILIGFLIPLIYKIGKRLKHL